MSKEPNKALESILEQAIETLFRPSSEMMQWKAQYWMTALTIDNATPEVSDVIRFCGSPKIREHWPRADFREWFLNKETYKARLEYLFDKATYAMEEILDNTDPKAQSARVNVIKHISELASKMPKPLAQGDDITKSITGMDKAQLDLFLEKNGVQLHMKASKGMPQLTEEAEVIDVEENKQ